MKVSLLPMVRILLFQSLLTMLFALPFISNAEASIITEKVSSYIFEGEELNLLKELNLEKKGKKIKSVSVQLQSTGHTSSVKIVVNKNVIKTLKVKANNNVISVNIPTSIKVNSLLLTADSVFVNNVSVILHQKPVRDVNTVKVVVKQKVIGTEKVSLSKLMAIADINIDDKKQVESISIKSKGRGLISITAGAEHKGSVFVAKRQTVQKIQTESIENQIKDIEFNINGRVSVQSMTVKLKPLEAPL